MVDKKKLEEAKALLEQDKKEKAEEGVKNTRKFLEEQLAKAPRRYVMSFHVLNDDTKKIEHFFSYHDWPNNDWKNIMQAVADEAGRAAMAATGRMTT